MAAPTAVERLARLHAMGGSTHDIIHRMTQMMYGGAADPEALRRDMQTMAQAIRTIADMLDMFLKLEMENEITRANTAATVADGTSGGS